MKSKLVIVEDHKNTLDNISSFFREQGYYTSYYNFPPSNLNEFRDATLCVIDITLGKEEDAGLKLSERIKKEYPNVPIIIMTMHKNNPEYYKRFIEIGLDDWIDKGAREWGPNLLLSSIDGLRKKGKINVPLKVGIEGLGNIGFEFLKLAIRSNRVEKIFVHSEFQYNKDRYSSIRKSLEIPNSNLYKKIKKDFLGKVSFNSSLESLVEDNPDFLALTSGPRFKQGMGREQELDEAVKILYPKLRTIKESKYKGSLIPSENPVEVILEIMRQMNFPVSKILGMHPDTPRAENYLRYYSGIDLKNDNLKILTTGSHSKVIPLLSSSKIKGRKNENYRIYRIPFVESVRGVGPDSMMGKEEVGSNIGVPFALMTTTEDFSNVEPTLHFCFSLWDPINKYFREMPVSVIYPFLEFQPGKFLEIEPPPEDKERIDYKKLDRRIMDYWETKQFERDIKINSQKQKDLAYKSLKSVGYFS